MEFEQLYQELALNGELLRQLVTGVTQVEGQKKPGPGSWSILEVVCHLYDEEREDFRQRLDIILNRPAEPWPPIDPGGWVNSRNYNTRDLAEMLARFTEERQQSLVWLRGLQAPNWEAPYTTPWGAMKAGDMLASWVAHDSLHMRQLVELKRKRIEHMIEPYDARYAGEW